MTADLTRAVSGVLAGACSVVAVVLGPLVLRVIDYRVSPAGVAQYVGCEPVTLAAGLVVAWAALFGRSDRAALFGCGAAAYLLYTMITVILGQDYTRYPGNGERFFPLFILLSIGALFSAAAFVAQVLRSATPHPGTTVRVTAVMFALLFAGLWISAIVGEGRSHSAEYLADPTLFWLVKYLDLAVVVPTCLVCAAVWSPTHQLGALVVLAFSSWMVLAIAGMQIGMVLLAGAPPASFVVAAIMTVGGLWSGWCVLAATT